MIDFRQLDRGYREGGTTLGAFISALEWKQKKEPGFLLKYGLSKPHSYRGYYECLAFEPCNGIRIEFLLKDALTCRGKTFEGYKGGVYQMEEHTEVFVAHYGECGDPLLPSMLARILGEEDNVLMMAWSKFEGK